MTITNDEYVCFVSLVTSEIFRLSAIIKLIIPIRKVNYHQVQFNKS